MDFTSINGTTVKDLTIDQYKTAMDISMSLLGFTISDLVFEPRAVDTYDIAYGEWLDNEYPTVSEEVEIPF